MSGATQFKANLLGVPEVTSEDEIRWCFRKWDLETIEFFHPVKVIVSFQSADDLNAALGPANTFILRGQSIVIEAEEKINVVDVVKPVEELPPTNLATIDPTPPAADQVDEYLQYLSIYESPVELTAAVETHNQEPNNSKELYPIEINTISNPEVVDLQASSTKKTNNTISEPEVNEPQTSPKENTNNQSSIDYFLEQKINELTTQSVVETETKPPIEMVTTDIQPKQTNIDELLENKIAELLSQNKLEDIKQTPIEVAKESNNKKIDLLEQKINELSTQSVVETETKPPIKMVTDIQTKQTNINELLENKIAELLFQTKLKEVEKTSIQVAKESNNKQIETKIEEMSVQCAFEVYKNTQNEITKKIDSKQFNLNDSLNNKIEQLVAQINVEPVESPIPKSYVHDIQTAKRLLPSYNSQPMAKPRHSNQISSAAGSVKYIEDFRKPNQNTTVPAKPIVANKTPFQPGMCLFCSQHAEHMCAKCGTFYCSTKCQTIDWSHHARTCFAMPELVAAAIIKPSSATYTVPQPIAVTNGYGPIHAVPQTGYGQKPIPANNGYGGSMSGQTNGSRFPHQEHVGTQPNNHQQRRSRSAQKFPHANNFKKSTGPPSNNVPNGQTPSNGNSSLIGNTSSMMGNTASNFNGVNPNYVNPFKKPITNSSINISGDQHRSSSRASDCGPRSRISNGGSGSVVSLTTIRPSIETLDMFGNWKESEPGPNPQATYTTPPPPIVKPTFNAGPSRVVASPLPTKSNPTSTHLATKPIVVPQQQAPSVTKAVIIPAPAAIKPSVASSTALSYCEFPPSNSLVMITAVVNAKQVFVRSVTEPLDDEYLNTLRAVALYGSTSAKQLDTQPTVGQMILAPNPDQTSQLRRALVLKTISATELQVAFIDYGSVSRPLMAVCRDLSPELQLRRRLVHICTIDEVAGPEKLMKLMAVPLVISYDEPFKPSGLVKLTLA